jgi:adenylate kinase family enzyme
MQTVAELIKNRSRKILIYGRPGTGKTAFALTAGARAFMLDLDSGVLVAEHLNDAFREDRLSVAVKTFVEPEPATKAMAYQQVKEELLSISNLCRQDKFPYEVVILDSVTMLADYALNFILRNSGKLGQQPEIQHWGLAINEVKLVMNILRTIPRHVIVIGHEQRRQSETDHGTTKTERIQLSVFGKNLPDQVAACFDEMWRFIVAPGPAYLIQTVPGAKADAKSRSCITNKASVNHGFWKILERMSENPTKETKPQEK